MKILKNISKTFAVFLLAAMITFISPLSNKNKLLNTNKAAFADPITVPCVTADDKCKFVIQSEDVADDPDKAEITWNGKKNKVVLL